MLDNTYIRRKVSRRTSRLAKYAPLCAWTGFVLLCIAVGAHRLGLIQQPNLVLIVAISLLISILTLLCAVKIFYNLWRSGDAGGRCALRASFIAVLTLTPPAFVLGELASTPRIHDVSTDLAMPVQYNTAIARFHQDKTNSLTDLFEMIGLSDLTVSNHISAEYDPDMLQQISAYPEVSGREYDSAQDHVLKAVLKVLKAQQMNVTGVSGSTDENMDLLVEATAKTYFLGLNSDLVVRLRDETEQTIVDMRAVSRFGRYDLGFNAEVIGAFFNELDIEMRNAVPDAREE